MEKRLALNRIHRHMKERCYNPNSKDYKNYGGRGINVCDEWIDKERVPHMDNATKGYLAFKAWALSNNYQKGLTLDRIDVNKGYSPDNCRWVDCITQANNKRNNKYIKYKGEVKTLAQWCKELNIDYSRTKARLNVCKWSVEQAFEIKYPLMLRRKGGVVR